MPICKVPPSAISRAMWIPAAYSPVAIGCLGTPNSGKSVVGPSSRWLKVSAGTSPSPGMKGSSEFTCPTSRNFARPSLRASSMSSVRSVLQLRL